MLGPPSGGLSHEGALTAYAALTFAFAIKAPIVPFHTWSPDTYAEAPTGASIVLAAVLANDRMIAVGHADRFTDGLSDAEPKPHGQPDGFLLCDGDRVCLLERLLDGICVG